MYDECFRVKGRETFYIAIDEIQRDFDGSAAHYKLEPSHQGYRLTGNIQRAATINASNGSTWLESCRGSPVSP